MTENEKTAETTESAAPPAAPAAAAPANAHVLCSRDTAQKLQVLAQGGVVAPMEMPPLEHAVIKGLVKPGTTPGANEVLVTMSQEEHKHLFAALKGIALTPEHKAGLSEKLGNALKT